ncbi:MAG: glycosyltransferase [Acidimicrobiia bacterium]|nr:glycosyltransferase [Acidimicrobiia bacterium]
MRAWRHANAFDDEELVVLALPVADSSSQVWWKPPGRAVTAGTSRPLGSVRPDAVRTGDPALLQELLGALPQGWRPDAIVVFRSYMATVGLALARRLRCSRTVLDLDDDDVAVLDSLGSPDAPAFERLISAVAPQFSAVTLASQTEEDGIVRRYGLTNTTVVPNGVDVPDEPLDYGDRSRTVAMVGNFTYAPNLRGAQWLRDAVWPHLMTQLAEPCALRLVGPGIGELDDLEPVYRAAAVMAVPLLEGGGTRLKVLEAWALGRPVVSTTVGVLGLDVISGREALVADEPEAFADRLAEVLADPTVGMGLVEAGRRAVEQHRAERVQAALKAVVFGG